MGMSPSPCPPSIAFQAGCPGISPPPRLHPACGTRGSSVHSRSAPRLSHGTCNKRVGFALGFTLHVCQVKPVPLPPSAALLLPPHPPHPSAGQTSLSRGTGQRSAMPHGCLPAGSGVGGRIPRVGVLRGKTRCSPSQGAPASPGAAAHTPTLHTGLWGRCPPHPVPSRFVQPPRLPPTGTGSPGTPAGSGPPLRERSPSLSPPGADGDRGDCVPQSQ